MIIRRRANFVTLCTLNQKYLVGSVVDELMQLTVSNRYPAAIRMSNCSVT